MRVIRYATKNAARTASRTFFNGAIGFGVLGTILDLAPSAIYGGASSQVISLALTYLGQEAQDAANDPPRSDYRTSTRSRRRRLPPVPGTSAVARESESFGEQAAYASSYISAFVRAFERSQGAELTGAADHLSEIHESEARLYAARASDALDRVAARASTAASAFAHDTELRRAAREQFGGEAGQRLIETPYWEKLPTEVRELLRESDVDPRDFLDDWQETWQVDDPVSSCIHLLHMSAEAAASLEISLHEWGPDEATGNASTR